MIYYIWNKKDIVCRIKWLFYPFWFSHDVLFIRQLFNADGSLMTYQELVSKYYIIIPIIEFNTAINAIPDAVIILFKNTAGHNPQPIIINPSIQTWNWSNLKIWSLLAKYLINNKVRELSFKIIHWFYPSSFSTAFQKAYRCKLLLLWRTPWRYLAYIWPSGISTNAETPRDRSSLFLITR